MRIDEGILETDEGVQALDALLLNNPEFEKLETLLDQFNIFEAIGAVWRELRHSDFLAYLVDPKQNHGMGDAFLKRLLQGIAIKPDSKRMPVRVVDLDVWDLNQVTVLREWQNIDILVVDEEHQFAVIVENKIASVEHSGQLHRYRQSVKNQYPEYRLISLYLTPDGRSPSDDAYIPISYGLVCETVEAYANRRASLLGAEIRALMIHYAQMLRRHIMPDSELADLCRQIYWKHRKALDLIYEHRPDRQYLIREILKDLITQLPLAESKLKLDYCGKSEVRFCPGEWDEFELLKTGTGGNTKRILLWVFLNQPDQLILQLSIYPGPENIRDSLKDMVRKRRDIFTFGREGATRWTQILRLPIINKKDYGNLDDDALETRIKKEWETFVKDKLPPITSAVNDHLENVGCGRER